MRKGQSALRQFDDRKALALFTQAAQQGSAVAYFYLGEIYYNGGNDTRRSYPRAFAYYEKAANAGVADGQYMLGMMYRQGYGCDKNISMAKRWLSKAASQGHTLAAQKLRKL